MKKNYASLVFNILLFTIFSLMAIEALGFREQARHFPLYISLLAVALIIVIIIKEIMNIRKSNEDELFHDSISRVYLYVAWFIMFAILIYIIGFLPASVVYLILFLRIVAKMKIVKAILVSIIAGIAIYFLSIYVELEWPNSLITLI